mmetsp:Transcript_21000/g.67670  ORF Transcript_21000/g.67670 Transcript_21000/m.67670 type:complete len:229 (-) Transcript_21000:381-1067(-)
MRVLSYTSVPYLTCRLYASCEWCFLTQSHERCSSRNWRSAEPRRRYSSPDSMSTNTHLRPVSSMARLRVVEKSTNSSTNTSPGTSPKPSFTSSCVPSVDPVSSTVYQSTYGFTLAIVSLMLFASFFTIMVKHSSGRRASSSASGSKSVFLFFSQRCQMGDGGGPAPYDCFAGFSSSKRDSRSELGLGTSPRAEPPPPPLPPPRTPPPPRAATSASSRMRRRLRALKAS